VKNRKGDFPQKKQKKIKQKKTKKKTKTKKYASVTTRFGMEEKDVPEPTERYPSTSFLNINLFAGGILQ